MTSHRFSTFCVAAPVDFEKDLKPVLEKKCLGCHLYLTATPDEPDEKPYMPEEGEPLTEHASSSFPARAR